ncbi:MAG TPA: AlpA family transcriptional regulator [Allosphingosinicella sp.]|jgi:prophage regulatory protein
MTLDTTDRILRLNAVLDRTGLSRSTLYRKIQAGTFPKQVRIAARCAGWRESAIQDWISNPFFYTAPAEKTLQPVRLGNQN